MKPFDLQKALAERFWAKVNKTETCWLWTSTLDRGGYGSFTTCTNGKAKSHRAHRVAWILVNGSIPSGMYICHACDTPSCVNPDHLFLGTAKTNMQDMARKGRTVFIVRRGQDNYRTKLTREQVLEIRSLKQTMTFRALGARYGVTPNCVYAICAGKTWKHIQGGAR